MGPDPAAVGGIETVIRTYAELLAPHATVRTLPTWRPDARAAGAAPALAALRRLAGLPRGAVVHVHLSHRGAFLREGALVRAAAALRRPVFVTVHGSDFVATSRTGLWRPVYAAVLRAADGVAVLNDGALAAVRRLAPRTPVTLLHNPGPVPADWRPATGAAAAPPTVVFAGEVSHRKGVDVLLAAWPAVLRAVPDATLVVAGPAGGVATDGVPGVRALGAVPPARVRELLGEARAAVLPSRAEAMPMFVLEAMAAGRPVVGTAVGAMPGMLAGAGRVVQPGDAAALAAALVAYLADPAAAGRDGAAGRERYLRDHSPAAAAHHLGVFYGLLGR
ncbi:hypothetical protein Sya03_42670 [Spirilliplanes yamanashiensis]|uniref:Glycosyltransferase n=1 Tax=Spirilliplanes yamanashiensis TaxID=42233 RepID=A0A8J3YBW6_9ACTN|nr:hypothetical protein Sya03_42670 [Spirilliplanes yamanashiensis]